MMAEKFFSPGCLFYAIMFILPPAAGQIKFTSKYDGMTVTGLVGSSVNFTWSFSGNVRSVVWGLKKDGVDVIQNGGELVSLEKNGPVSVTVPSAYNGRVSGSGDASSGQVTFTLSSIRMSDKGFYGCKIKPTDFFDQETFDSVYLAVKAAPKIDGLTIQSSYIEGSAVNITCSASGTPDPDVQWTRNGKVENSGKNTAFLTFSNVNRADGGQYTCRANNSVGSAGYHTTLVVHYKPEGTTLNTTAAYNTVTQGGSLTFTCHVTAAKPQVSRYRFYLNDTTLVKDSNNNQYTINIVQRSQHYGKYNCIPSNDVGDGPEATAILNVNVPVQFTVFPQNVTVNETNPVVLSCDASGFPEPSFTWTKDGQQLSQSGQLYIQRSDRSVTGMYVCTASNGIGQDMTSQAYVTVH